MDKKTVFLLIAEALLVVILVVVVAVDYEPGPQTKTVVVETHVPESETVAAAHETAVAEKNEVEHAAKPAEVRHTPEPAEAEPVETAEEPGPVEKVAEAAEAVVEDAAEVAEEVVEEVKEVVAAATGGGAAPDVIAMSNSLYPEHTKPIVQFTHAKHVQDYGIGCGECHHDDSAQPLANLKMGDPVAGCGECHSEAGRPGPEAKTPSDKLAYHMQAVHQNCIGCHKDYNTEKGVKDAPQTCAQCHPKEE